MVFPPSRPQLIQGRTLNIPPNWALDNKASGGGATLKPAGPAPYTITGESGTKMALRVGKLATAEDKQGRVVSIVLPADVVFAPRSD
jgi:hypothetical protein